jgi:CubicO group peptidase (beta-lactamase class C family)
MTTPGPTIDRAHVEAAVAKLCDRIGVTMRDTGLPGLAVGVVFDDEVMIAQGFGVRRIDDDAPVDADTVFQLASLSKPLGGSVMAALVGRKVFAWNDPVRTGDPRLTLSDPWVSDHVTYADLYSHRSGLPEFAGDLLEDLGYDRATVLGRLRHYRLDPFRGTYAYTNFGLTAAAVAGAAKAGMTWEEAARKEIYEPLGMTSTSSTHADFAGRPNKASGHVRKEGKWIVTPQQRRPDAQSPAGGASSTVNDMLRWLRMEIGTGTVEGQPVVDAEALARTWWPHALAHGPKSPTGRAGFYGIGFNVGYDDAGRLRLGHSGAFLLGAGTVITLFPAERIGIVVLTNGEPAGIAEAMVESFYDDLFHGRQTEDWLSVIGKAFADMLNPKAKKDFANPPAGSAGPGPDERYVGAYANDFYGPLEVSAAPAGGCSSRSGPRGRPTRCTPTTATRCGGSSRERTPDRPPRPPSPTGPTAASRR